MKNFSKWLKEQRTKKGLTQFALAQLIGLNETTIWNIENAKRPAARITRRKLMRFFNDGIIDQEPTIERLKKRDQNPINKIQNALNLMPVEARKLFKALVAEAYHTVDGYPAMWRTVSLPIKKHLEQSGKKATDANIARVRKAAEKLDKALLSTGIGWTRIRSDVWERDQIADQCGISDHSIYIRFSMTFVSVALEFRHQSVALMLGLEAK